MNLAPMGAPEEKVRYERFDGKNIIRKSVEKATLGVGTKRTNQDVHALGT